MVIRLHCKQQHGTRFPQFCDGKQANAFVLISNPSVVFYRRDPLWLLRGINDGDLSDLIGEPMKRENGRRAKLVTRLHYKQQRSTKFSRFRDGKQANAFVLILNLSVSPSSM